MIIIALGNNNSNTNSIEIKIQESTTLKDIVEMEAVKEFFRMDDTNEILDSLQTIDGLDVEVVSSLLSTVQVDNNSELQFDLYGERPVEAETQQSKVSKLGSAELVLSGGFNVKRVAIIQGETRLGDLLTQDTAAFFASTVDTLHTMRFTKDDVDVDTAYFVQDGDSIVMQPRKAGDKGSGDTFSVLVTDGEGFSYTYHLSGIEGMTIHDLICDLFGSATAKVTNIDNSVVSPAFEDTICRHTYAVPGMRIFVDVVGDTLLLTETGSKDLYIPCACDAGNLAFLLAHTEGFETFEIFDDEDEAASGDLSVSDVYIKDMKATEQAEDRQDTAETVLGTAEKGKFGAVIVARPLGFDNLEVGMQNLVSKVKDVLFSQKVLSALAMTEEQARSMRISINDVDATLDDTLVIGDVITIQPRKAGDKGTGK